MKLNISNNQESANVQNAQVINAAIKREQSGAGSSYAEHEQGRDESLNNSATIAEPIEDAVVVSEESSSTSESKRGKGAKKKGAPKKSEASFYLVTYQTKHGGTGSYVMGFKTEQEAKALADNACKTVNATWRYNDKGEKVYALSFGSRYLDIAKRLCEALNNSDKAAVSKAIAKTHDVYAAAVEADL